MESNLRLPDAFKNQNMPKPYESWYSKPSLGCAMLESQDFVDPGAAGPISSFSSGAWLQNLFGYYDLLGKTIFGETLMYFWNISEL